MSERCAYWTVYRLLYKRMLVYIGITSGPLEERLQEHMEPGRVDNPVLASMAQARCKLQIEPIDVIYGIRRQAERRESFYIRELRPVANIQHTRRKANYEHSTTIR